jgi:predicted membrane-bound spermidine synthase
LKDHLRVSHSASTPDRSSPHSNRTGLILALAGVAFFFSGVSALVYQVAWQRILALHTGVGIYSIALIVASFMAGLGLGSHLGGWASFRLGAAKSLVAFAMLELGIGLFGLLSCTFFYDLLYLRASWLYESPWTSGALHFLALLIPTTMMGMSLPFLVRATVRDAETAGRVIGDLYGINVIGAGVGALVTPWILVRFLGIRGAVTTAAAGNSVAFLVAAVLVVVLRRNRDRPISRVTQADRLDGPVAQPYRIWIALYALSGFCAMSLEIVWFRIVDLGTKSMAFSFGTVLALYLVFYALGSLVGARLVSRVSSPLYAFLICQSGLIAYAGTAVFLLVSLPPDTPFYSWFADYWGRSRAFVLSDNLWSPAAMRLYLALPAMLFGPATFLMGLSFPILQRAVQDDPQTSGRKVGFLQAANIAGGVAGSLLVGLLLLNHLGTMGSFRFLMGCGLIFAAVGIRRYGMRSWTGLAGAFLVVFVVTLPTRAGLWNRLHGVFDGRAIVGEDATGVSALVPEGKGRFRVFVNGKSHSWLPFGGSHTRLGAVPAIVHPSPKDIAIIGLGSGNTAWAAAMRQETRAVTVFEISGPQPRVLERLADAYSDDPDLEQLREFLEDPRIHIKVADGRKALELGRNLYDIIQADPLHPAMAYSGYVYSTEFFELCARRLKPGGIMCSWSPTSRVYHTFRHVFPYVLEIEGGGILMGSNERISIDRRTWRERVLSPRTASYMGGWNRARWLLETVRTVRKPRRPPAPRIDLNHDLFPRDEFVVP